MVPGERVFSSERSWMTCPRTPPSGDVTLGARATARQKGLHVLCIAFIGSVDHVYQYSTSSGTYSNERQWGALYVFEDALVIAWQPVVVLRPGKPRELRDLDSLPNAAVTRDQVVERARSSIVIENTAIVRAVLKRRRFVRRLWGWQLDVHLTDGGMGVLFVSRRALRPLAAFLPTALGDRFEAGG